jgi:hypothetical protein
LDLRLRIAKTKIVQKIETGGTSKTSTPIFKFLTNALFDCSDALHMTHWAIADSHHERKHTAPIAATAKTLTMSSRLTVTNLGFRSDGILDLNDETPLPSPPQPGCLSGQPQAGPLPAVNDFRLAVVFRGGIATLSI